MLRTDHAGNSSFRPQKDRWQQCLGRAAGLFIIVAVVSVVPVVRDSEVRLNDTFFRLASPPREPSHVVLVLIDEESLQKYGRWPWPRALLAQLNTNLAEAGASAIGLDILLSEPESAEADSALAQSFRASGRTVIVDKIGAFPEGPRWIEPLPKLAQSASVGHAQAILDSDSICRRFPPQELTLDGPRWAFAIELAYRVDRPRLDEFLSAHEIAATGAPSAVSVAAPTLVRIPYRRDGFQTISALQALERRDLERVRGRPVVVGFGPAEIGDRLPTPLSQNWPTPGAEIHAQILDSILSGRRLRDVPMGWSALVLTLTCVLTIAVAQRWRGNLGLVWLGTLAAGAYGVAFLCYSFAGYMLPAGPLLLAVILGPVLVYGADVVRVDRAVTQQLLGLRVWLQGHGTEDVIKGELSWKLRVLQNLQTELGALYELHRAFLESTQDLVAIFDERGNLILRNQLFSTVCLPEQEDPSLDQFRARLSAKEDAGLIENAARLEGEVYLGSTLYSLRLSPLPPAFLSPKGGTILTMTSLHTREERDRARAEVLAFITHELRTPLTSIQGFAELMMHYPSSLSCQSAPQTIFRESKRLLAMINTYLSVLRLDEGSQPLQAIPIDVEELVKQVVDILQPLADANRMRLTLSGDREPVVVVGDAHLLTGAILNLVSNALKYGEPGTDIEVSWWERNNETTIAVRNRGEAVPSHSMRRIFEPYYRDAGAEKITAGWGLGLAFVKRIAEKHGGSVTVDSGPESTTFEIHVPANLAAAPAARVTT